LEKTLQKFRWWLSILFCILNFSGQAGAQHGPQPIFVSGHKELTVSLGGDFFSRNIAGVENRLQGYRLEASYGGGSKLDIWASLGLVRLTLDGVDSTQMTLADGHKVGYGGGLNYRFFRLRRSQLSFVGSFSFYRFVASPSIEETILVANTKVLQIQELTYDWREWNASFGMARRLGRVDLYAGVNFRYTDRPEKKRSRLVFGSDAVETGEVAGTYQSGLIVSPALVLDVNFAARLKLSVAVVARNRSDYLLRVGLSQTGRP